MSFLSFRSIASAPLVLLMGQAAQAEIDAKEVWDNWRLLFENAGYELSANDTPSGRTLNLNDLIITGPESEGISTFSMAFEQVALRTNDDGTVSLLLPAVTPFVIEVSDADDEVSGAQMELRQTGFEYVVSGAVDNMVNSYEAARAEVVLTGLMSQGVLTETIVENQGLGVNPAFITIALEGLSGSSKIVNDTKRFYDQTMEASGFEYDIAAKYPEGDGSAAFSGTMSDLRFEGSGELPLAPVDTNELSAMLAAGFNSTGAFAYAAGASNIKVTENGADTFSSETKSDGGTLNLAIAPEGMVYSGAQTNLELALNLPELDVPLDMDVAKSRFNLTAPLQKSDEAEDFALGFVLNDVIASDALWNLIDADKVLPRDAANVALDLTGKAQILLDLFSAAPETLDAPPAQLESLDINRLLIEIAGARLSGDGAFRFDTSTPAGIQPTGVLDLTLAGGNALLDKLVEIGVLPEDQAMGARMMMGLLAAPGEQPDTLNSRIEVNEQGHVLANGQRIQ